MKVVSKYVVSVSSGNLFEFFTLLGFVFQVLKVRLICKIEPPDLLFLIVFLAFTSADIIFHKFLELHSVLSVKKIFVTNFLF